MGGAKTAAQTQQSKEEKEKAQLRKRINRLEKYLDVIGSSSQEYVIQRIHALARGSVLAAYSWNSGGQWKDRPWSTELPTDAQIVMHLFCTFLDCRVNDTTKSFTSNHFVPTSGETRAAAASDIKIQQTHLHPPHFKVVARVGGEKRIWEVQSGRNNLFHTLILLAYYIQLHKNGYWHQIDLRGDGIGLLQVIEL